MKYRDIEIPEELLPGNSLVELAKSLDVGYVETYEALKEATQNTSASDIIGLMAKVNTEKIALMIGSDLSRYDKEMLMSIIERYIAGKVFKG